jgi:hypothetical protein
MRVNGRYLLGIEEAIGRRSAAVTGAVAAAIIDNFATMLGRGTALGTLGDGRVICRVLQPVLGFFPTFPGGASMAHHWSRAIMCAAGAALLAACAGEPVAYYAPPPGLTPSQGVTILGSEGDTFFLQSIEYHAVWEIDGVAVEDPVWNWHKPLLVTANEPHRLRVVYDWGPVAGGGAFDFTGSPGSTVVLKAEDVKRQELARMWLEDAQTGQVVTDKQLVQLDYITTAPVPVGASTTAIVNRVIRNATPMVR